MKIKAAIIIIITLLSLGDNTRAQSKYSAYEAFAPFFYPNYGDKVRAADGTPGPEYWQNRADYSINVSMDDSLNSIQGNVNIEYTNNSTQPLSFLWLQMDQNIYAKKSRGSMSNAAQRFAGAAGFEGGYGIQSIMVSLNGKEYTPEYTINDTRMQVQLPKPLKSNGGTVTLKINYRFLIPERGTDRMGRMQTKNGWIYEIAQWFPRMCVYDNVQGWNTLPYIGQGEFYLEYGDISYNITLPSGYVVVGSGELLNPKEVLSARQIERWNSAKQSEQTVMLRTAEEVAQETASKNSGKNVTWKFKCTTTRDVAWACSKAFVWDAARINLPEGRSALAMSVYPVESARDDAWKLSTQFVKGSIEYYSRYLYPYTYPTATNVAGNVFGMEYPGIVFCGAGSDGNGLWGVTSHEFGHNWFPMIVGTNERKFSWMDEGFNTFINGMVDSAFDNGKYRDTNSIAAMARYIQGDTIETIMTIADLQRNLGLNSYTKPGAGLRMLREGVLGKKRFDKAFSYYVNQWAFKHPTPFDFFHCMENASGETLDWFWRGWFMKGWKIDFAVSSVTDNAEGGGSLVAIDCLERMPMPIVLELTEVGGNTRRISVPVERWQQGSRWQFRTAIKLTKVEIDPDRILPDINISNNSWSANQ